jgi:hypothetical protein
MLISDCYVKHTRCCSFSTPSLCISQSKVLVQSAKEGAIAKYPVKQVLAWQYFFPTALIIYGDKATVTFTSPFLLSCKVGRPLLDSRHLSPSLSSLSSSPGSPPPPSPFEIFRALSLEGHERTVGGSYMLPNQRRHSIVKS